MAKIAEIWRVGSGTKCCNSCLILGSLEYLSILAACFLVWRLLEYLGAFGLFEIKWAGKVVLVVRCKLG